MGNHSFTQKLVAEPQSNSPHLELVDGARVAIVGGGPAGSLFGYFLLDLAQRAGLELQVDIYEPRDFSLVGPPGCNMCAGIISESLIQMLVMEGIHLPPDVVQRGMDTYMLHTNAGKACLETPQLEKRIGTVFRGAGPLGMKDDQWGSFDGFLLEQAIRKGASLIRDRVNEVMRVDDRLQVKSRLGSMQCYDLLAVATGVNTNALRLFEPLETGFQQPEMVQTFVREYFVGQEKIESHMGHHTIHFFLLDLPGLDFAAVVPKGNYVTVYILGNDLSKELFEDFLNTPEAKDCMSPGWQPEAFICHCAPRINISGAIHPYADRMVSLGDSGVSRLYKDGIGAAYRAAKYAAATAIFHGISEEDFRRHYWNSCQRMEYDNRAGKFIFAVVRKLKPRRFAMRGIIRMVENERPKQAGQRRMSKIMWDMFTGSAPYREILMRCFHPAFWGHFLWYVGTSLGGRA